jgi:hypothetical protein
MKISCRAQGTILLVGLLSLFIYADEKASASIELAMYGYALMAILWVFVFCRKEPVILLSAVMATIILFKGLTFTIHYTLCICLSLTYTDPEQRNRVFRTACKTIFPSAPVMKTVNYPCIYVCNHAYKCCADVAMLAATLPEKTRLLAYSNTTILGEGRNSTDSTPTVLYISSQVSGKYKYTRDIIDEQIKKGFSVVVFPEKTREKTSQDEIAPLRSGIFHIAKELNVPIVPLHISWPADFPIFVHGLGQPTTSLGTPIVSFESIEEAMDNTRMQLSGDFLFQNSTQNKNDE